MTLIIFGKHTYTAHQHYALLVPMIPKTMARLNNLDSFKHRRVFDLYASKDQAIADCSFNTKVRQGRG
jgi:hypothetical protein